DVVEFPVCKGEIPPVGSHKPQSRMTVFQKLRVIQAACCNPIFVGIPYCEVIGMAIGPVTRYSKIEQRVLRLDSGRREKDMIHFAPLVGGYLDRDRVGFSDIVLSEYCHTVSIAI